MKDIFLIDADETVLDFRRAEREAFSTVLKSLATEQLYARYHAINDALWKRLECGDITRERLKVERFRQLFEEFSIQIDPKQASSDYFEAIAHNGYYLEGAEEFLHTLKSRGRVYIVTNGAAYTQHSRFRACGLDRLADGVFISEEIGYNKPSEEYAAYVEEHIEGYDRSRAVWFGDSVTSDRLCAKRRGIDFVLYAPNATCGENTAYPVAHSYPEFLQLLSVL